MEKNVDFACMVVGVVQISLSHRDTTSCNTGRKSALLLQLLLLLKLLNETQRDTKRQSNRSIQGVKQMLLRFSFQV